MKTMLLLTVALFAIPASQAFSQSECNSGYEACMNTCSSRNSSQQSDCIMSCQEKTNQCSVRYFGRSPQDDGGQVQVNSDPEPSIAPVDAQSARDEGVLPKRKKSKR